VGRNKSVVFQVTTLLFVITLSIPLVAQDRCATVPYMEKLYLQHNRKQNKQQFEQWLQTRMAQKQSMQQQQRKQTEPYQVPVVVHVIHNGDAYGTNENIPDEQIFSQLRVLNEDFNRQNDDAALTPALFVPLASSIDIEFILARQDPAGNPTTGIVRVNGGRASWNLSDNTLLKSKSYWPSENYLNIWVCNIPSLLGYAQFPISDLEGLEDEEDIAETDGVVIAYDAFGSEDDGDFDLQTDFAKGRTLTHEMGHFLGLLHIWGDDNACEGSDYVADTPNQNQETSGCPAHPRTTCGEVNMFQNYMDYSNDACMNLFSQGQVARMEFILDEPLIPRRQSLLSSPGLGCPVGFTLDVSLRDIPSPNPLICNLNNTLKVSIQNVACDPITSARITYQLNNQAAVATTLTFPALAASESTTLSIPIVLTEGECNLSVSVDQPNGMSDASANNNSIIKKIIVNSPVQDLPARERFDVPFANRWTIVNPFSDVAWQSTSTNYNQSLRFEASGNGQIETSWLVSPVLDYSAITSPNLSFDWSYDSDINRPTLLEIKYTNDCGTTYTSLSDFSFDNTVTDKTPDEPSDWRTATINLSSLSGLSNVRLAFVVSSLLGNPIYLDNIELYTGKAGPKLSESEVFSVYPSVDGGLNITFSTNTVETVAVSVVDMMGRSIINERIEKILNQTIALPVASLQTGIYIVRVKADNRYYSQKVFIAR
jgi:Pregnancy-associated plasma protein-A/Secretion system C-terminal sorting domain/CARDB